MNTGNNFIPRSESPAETPPQTLWGRAWLMQRLRSKGKTDLSFVVQGLVDGPSDSIWSENFVDLRDLREWDQFIAHLSSETPLWKRKYTVLRNAEGKIRFYRYSETQGQLIWPYEVDISEPRQTYLVYKQDETSPVSFMIPSALKTQELV